MTADGISRLMTAESRSSLKAEQPQQQRYSSVFLLNGLSTEIKDDKLLQVWSAKSAFVVREIVQTEKLYVQSLEEIVQVHYPYTSASEARHKYFFSRSLARRDILRRCTVVCCRLAEDQTSSRPCFPTSSSYIIYTS